MVWGRSDESGGRGRRLKADGGSDGRAGRCFRCALSRSAVLTRLLCPEISGLLGAVMDRMFPTARTATQPSVHEATPYFIHHPLSILQHVVKNMAESQKRVGQWGTLFLLRMFFTVNVPYSGPRN